MIELNKIYNEDCYERNETNETIDESSLFK